MLYLLQREVTDALPGYLTVVAGQQVRILYVGSDERLDEWFCSNFSGT